MDFWGQHCYLYTKVTCIIIVTFGGINPTGHGYLLFIQYLSYFCKIDGSVIMAYAVNLAEYIVDASSLQRCSQNYLEATRCEMGH